MQVGTNSSFELVRSSGEFDIDSADLERQYASDDVWFKLNHSMEFSTDVYTIWPTAIGCSRRGVPTTPLPRHSSNNKIPASNETTVLGIEEVMSELAKSMRATFSTEVVRNHIILEYGDSLASDLVVR